MTRNSNLVQETQWPPETAENVARPDLDVAGLVDGSSDAAFAVNGDMKIISWNDAAEKLLGYSPGEAMGVGCASILQACYPTGEPLCSAQCESRDCFQTGEKWSVGTCRIRRMDGHMISASIATMVIPEDGRTRRPDAAIAIIFLRQAEGDTNSTAIQQPLRIYTLGQFDLVVNGSGLDVESWKRKQAVVLLKILVVQVGRPVHRERLIEWLWPEVDVESGWKRLKVIVSFLRDKLRSAGAPEDVIETVGKTYLLRQDAVRIDSIVFETLVSASARLMTEGLYPEAQSRFEEAASLYRGEYLEDMLYVDWCAEERGRLCEIYLELLAGMVRCYAVQNQFAEAVQVCRTALVTDPCRESFLRAQLEYLVKLGRADWAEKEFTRWRHVLQEDYGLQPTAETLQTYQRLVTNI